MRIATYNLWNSETDWAQRLAAAAEELELLAADIVALQEAPNEASPGRALTDYLEVHTPYHHVLHLPYPPDPDDDRPEGLAVLSNVPFEAVRTSWSNGEATDNNFAIGVHVDIGGRKVSVTNVHLDWERPLGRLEAISDIVDRLIAPTPAPLEVLCGDFNDYEDGPIARFLEHPGEDAARGGAWLDAVASVAPDAAPFTLDFLNNPRWHGVAVTEKPGRFDRVYLRGTAAELPRVVEAGVFGREPRNRFGVVPSDHYGVFVDLEP